MSAKNNPPKAGQTGDEKSGVKPVHEVRLGRIRAAVNPHAARSGVTTRPATSRSTNSASGASAPPSG